MAKGSGQIGLSVAERRRPTRESFDYRSSSMERWVTALPAGNIGETARLVYGALQEVNRLDIPWKERQRFLEQLREPVSYVQESLVKRYTRMSLPLPPKAQRIAHLAQTLYLEMALGYKTAIEEMLGSSFLTRDNKALTELIHRAIRYLSHAILSAYQTYSPHPPNSWFELHMLYLHAEYKQLHRTPVMDTENKIVPESSIARAYKQLLLLALASPYRLRHGEAESIYNALARWAGHAQIIPYTDPSASEALFVVHMDSDDAPDYQLFNTRDCNTELCRLVDTRQLSHILSDELAYQEQQKDTGTLSVELMQRLIRSWGIAPRRHFTRAERNLRLEVVVGTNMLHQALAFESGDESLYNKRATFQSRSVAGVSQPTTEDIWDIFASHTIRKSYDTYEKQQQPTQQNAPHPLIRNWSIRNESAGGYRLASDNDQEAKVQVGELLGLRSESGRRWEVGAVRWIRQSAEGGLEIGVQILAPEARPVRVRNVKATGKSSEYQYALVLPAIDAIGQPASIITPILLFSPGNELLLRMQNQETTIVLHEMLQDSGTFVQYRFTPRQQVAPRPRTGVPAGEEQQGGFANVWQDL